MSLSINTDIANLKTQKNLGTATNAVNTALQRMSTGFKVNSAKDDAAGLYVATKLNTQISGLKQAQSNVQMGTSLLQTADGAYSDMQTILNRLRDLSVQSANGVYDENSRLAIQQEADSLTAELERIKNSTSYNGLSLFNNLKTSVNPTLATALTLVGGGGLNSLNISSVNAYNITSESLTATTFGLTPTPRDVGAVSGAIDFSAGQTQTVTLDGKSYEITNRNATNQQLTYTIENGTIKFTCSYFTIKGQTDAPHNLDIAGKNNVVYTGDLADTVTFSLSGDLGRENYIYAGAGNDTVTSSGYFSYLFGEAGDDTFNIYGSSNSVYGGDGKDTFNINNNYSNYYGGNDDDTFVLNTNSSSVKLYGEGGDDNFTINGGSNNFINGGDGTNTLLKDSGTNTTAVNVGAKSNAYAESFAANETKTILINSLSYEITNNKTTASDFVYKLNGSQIDIQTEYFTIKAQKDAKHNFLVNAYNITIHGGNQGDTVSGSSYGYKFYGGDGDDTVVAIGTNGDTNIWGGKGKDNITINNPRYSFVDGGEDDDTITVTTATYGGGMVYGGSGNDTFNLTGTKGGVVTGGDGNDTFNVSGSNFGIIGGSGTNTVNDTGTNNAYSNISNATSKLTEVTFSTLNETKNVTIGGVNYSVKNLADYCGNTTKTLAYYLDEATGEVSLYGNYFEITTQSDKAVNVKLYGVYNTLTTGTQNDTVTLMHDNNTIYTGSGDDMVIHNGTVGNYIYTQDGDDNIVLNNRNDYTVDAGTGDDTITIKSTANSVKGGEGNDTYNVLGSNITINDNAGSNVFNVSGSGNNVTGGSGMDTFYITGTNNHAQGGGANDYFVIDGSNNSVDGGSGVNKIVDNGTSNTTTNTEPDPNSGTLYFNAINQIQTIELGGKTYTLTNTTETATPTASNSVQYYYNALLDEVTFTGNNLTIKNEDDKAHNLVVKGNNNTVQGSNQKDKITISTGTNNAVYGNDGDDTIIMNTSDNKISGGNGNDTITLNATTSKTVSGDGDNDTITVNSSNNTNVQGNDGNDSITATGNNNTIDGGIGDDTLLAIGSTNTLTSTSGNNHVSASGDNNTLTTGNGTDTITVSGNTNTIDDAGSDTILTINGDDNISNTTNGSDTVKITGNANAYTTESGTNEVTVKGSQNNIQGGSDAETVKIYGDENVVKGGESNDKFTVYKGDLNDLDGEGGDRNTVVDKGTNTIKANLVDITPGSLEVRLQVGANENDSIEFAIGFDMEGFYVDYTSTQSSLENIDRIDELMQQISTQRSDIGAVMNRLDSVLQSQTTTIENYTAAKSTIMDADISQESADYVRNQILQQTSIALMSSAKNLRASLLMSLIK